MTRKDELETKLGRLIMDHEGAVEEEKRVTKKHTIEMHGPTLSALTDEAVEKY